VKYSVRTEKLAVGNWATDFQGNAAETREYLRERFKGYGTATPALKAQAAFSAGLFRVYGGEGNRRARLGIRALRMYGVL